MRNADDDFRLPFYTGWLMGAFHSPDVVKYFTDRGIDAADVEVAYESLMKLTGAFFYEPTDSGDTGPTAAT